MDTYEARVMYCELQPARTRQLRSAADAALEQDAAPKNCVPVKFLRNGEVVDSQLFCLDDYESYEELARLVASRLAVVEKRGKILQEMRDISRESMYVRIVRVKGAED